MVSLVTSSTADHGFEPQSGLVTEFRGSVMVSLVTSSTTDHGFEPQSGSSQRI
jgi:hypothetical protein